MKQTWCRAARLSDFASLKYDTWADGIRQELDTVCATPGVESSVLYVGRYCRGAAHNNIEDIFIRMSCSYK